MAPIRTKKTDASAEPTWSLDLENAVRRLGNFRTGPRLRFNGASAEENTRRACAVRGIDRSSLDLVKVRDAHGESKLYCPSCNEYMRPDSKSRTRHPWTANHLARLAQYLWVEESCLHDTSKAKKCTWCNKIDYRSDSLSIHETSCHYNPDVIEAKAAKLAEEQRKKDEKASACNRSLSTRVREKQRATAPSPAPTTSSSSSLSFSRASLSSTSSLSSIGSATSSSSAGSLWSDASAASSSSSMSAGNPNFFSWPSDPLDDTYYPVSYRPKAPHAAIPTAPTAPMYPQQFHGYPQPQMSMPTNSTSQYPTGLLTREQLMSAVDMDYRSLCIDPKLVMPSPAPSLSNMNDFDWASLGLGFDSQIYGNGGMNGFY